MSRNGIQTLVHVGGNESIEGARGSDVSIRVEASKRVSSNLECIL